MTNITVSYLSIDRFRKTRRFKTLAGARKFAHNWIGEAPTLGAGYAISDDGVGRITVQGATLAELFPRTVEPALPAPTAGWDDNVDEDYHAERAAEYAGGGW